MGQNTSFLESDYNDRRERLHNEPGQVKTYLILNGLDQIKEFCDKFPNCNCTSKLKRNHLGEKNIDQRLLPSASEITETYQDTKYTLTNPKFALHFLMFLHKVDKEVDNPYKFAAMLQFYLDVYHLRVKVDRRFPVKVEWTDGQEINHDRKRNHEEILNILKENSAYWSYLGPLNTNHNYFKTPHNGLDHKQDEAWTEVENIIQNITPDSTIQALDADIETLMRRLYYLTTSGDIWQNLVEKNREFCTWVEGGMKDAEFQRIFTSG